MDHAPRHLRERKMSTWLLTHVMRVVSLTPWLYLDEIAREVDRASRTRRPDRLDGKSYSLQHCHTQLQTCGRTMETMRAKAANRNGANHSECWRAVGEECNDAAQLFEQNCTGWSHDEAQAQFVREVADRRRLVHIHCSRMISVLTLLYLSE